MERLFKKACSDRARNTGFKPKEGKARLDIRKTFYDEGGEILAQRSCGYPTIGSVQNQVLLKGF